LEREPFGVGGDFRSLKLENRTVEIGGFKADFPLGVPASILTANASYLQYYADRGYSILTYKTVRSTDRPGHPFPQWVCLEDPEQFQPGPGGVLIGEPSFKGRVSLAAKASDRASMANSFGVPSLGPIEWSDDLRKARAFVREGHQILIVSVMASINTNLEAVAADFAKTAWLAQCCGADIIELNFSCPNTSDAAGMIYHFPQEARRICDVVREALGPKTPILAKIGYLDDRELEAFVAATADVVDGFVAINTMSAIVNRAGAEKPSHPVFPGEKRETAGVSGWAIKQAAHHMARVLVELRDRYSAQLGRPLHVLGLGGVMTRDDFNERLALGVDAVEICTGTYFNPMLGFECRNAKGDMTVNVRNGTLNEGVDISAEGRADSRLPPGATARAHGGGAKMVDPSQEKPPEISKSIDPVQALALVKRYYRDTPKEKILASWEARMAELDETYNLDRGLDRG
jgi:dihydroorotate dehydrogenase